MQIILRRRGNPVRTRVTPLIQELVDPVPLEKIPFLEWGKNNEKTKTIFIEIYIHYKYSRSFSSRIHISY